MLVRIVGVVLICLAGLTAYAALRVGTIFPVIPEDVSVIANATRVLGVAAGALFIGGMMAVLRR